jgi:TolA-binding protein
MEDALKFTLIPAFFLFSLNSCSWYRNLERSLDESPKDAKRSQTVSRSQYDQLLVKYEELSKKYEQLKEKPKGSQDTLIDELQNTKTDENFSQGSTSDAETVDVFSANEGKVDESLPVEVPADVKSQIILFRRGVALKSSNQSEATKIFQELDHRAVFPIKVRAKYNLGEMLLEKGQFDLALQIFEDIINKHASSGIVLLALKGAVLASEKLGMMNKKDQYFSMLDDVFGSDQGT